MSKITIDRADLRLILDDLDSCYENEGYDLAESGPDEVVEAYSRLRLLLDGGVISGF